jgi:hypothetical protein
MGADPDMESGPHDVKGRRKSSKGFYLILPGYPPR